MLFLSLFFFRDFITSVYLEVRGIYISNRKCDPNDGSYAKRTKLNIQERKIVPLLEEKGRFRNVSVFPRD